MFHIYRRSRNPAFWISLFLLIVSFLLPVRGITETDENTLAYLKTLSIEELLELKVTSVSKRPETLFNAAAAITVITPEDIRRTGARTIPDILRLVPGIQVGQVDGSKWEIGARGFNDFFENKLLVLIDGRSLYTPLYSGIYWDRVDTILEDIERIEVIRGPGATVWGANAVNGVINIISKNSAETQGGLVQAMYGTREQPLAAARFGGRFGETTAYRFYVKGFKRDEMETASGADAHDALQSSRAGLRLDSSWKDSSLSFQSELYKGEADFTSLLSGFLTPPFFRRSEETEKFHGGHILTEYHHNLSKVSDVNVKLYYTGYTQDLVVVEEERDTFDFELQHHLKRWPDHQIVWGVGVRWTEDETEGTFSTTFTPASESTVLWSAFLQDDISVVENTLWCTVGSKFEHNDYSGFEIQPSIRLRYMPEKHHLLWAAISRAVRTPSRTEQDVTIHFASFQQGPTPVQLRLVGNDDFDSEELIAYEFGYRWQWTDSLSVDVATFYNDYDDLRGERQGRAFLETAPLPSHLVIPNTFVNNIEGESYGIEISTAWQVLEHLKLMAGYSWMDLNLEYSDRQQSNTLNSLNSEKNYPRHQFQIRGYYDMSPSLSLNGELYYVDEYESDTIGEYLRFDLQLLWEPLEALQLAVGGENLLSSGHKEAIPTGSGIVSSHIPPTYWLKATYRF